MSTHSVMILFVQNYRRQSTNSVRAQPRAVEERRAMIIDAIMPLLAEFGVKLTSKQIAEAAGVAEGTVFRAFGDKESLIEAAVEKFLDPEPLRRELRSIPMDLPLDDKVMRIVELMRKRFGVVFRVMASIRSTRPPQHSERNAFAESVHDVLAAHADDMNWSSDQTAQVIRLVTFASSIKQLNMGMEFTTEEFAQIVLYGIAGKPASAIGIIHAKS